jgi:hypothetical protein
VDPGPLPAAILWTVLLSVILHGLTAGPFAAHSLNASRCTVQQSPPTRDADRAGGADILVDGVHPQPRALAVGRGIHLAHQPVVVQDGKREEAPTSLRPPV